MSALPTSTSMLKASPSTPVDRAAEAPSTTVNSIAPLLTLDLADAITLALARCGLSHKDAAFTMGLDPAQWSRQLHGDGHISLQRLQRLPETFWHEFLPLLGGRVRMSVTSLDALDFAMLRIGTLVQEIGSYVVAASAARRVA